MKYYLAVLKNYAGFSGRARRKEYWMFALFNFIFLIVAMILDNVLGTTIEEVGYGLIYFLYVLAVLIPSIAVTVRRLHDIGKSGWMFLILLIPIIGAIWLLVLMVMDSDPRENQYGPNPNGIVTNIQDITKTEDARITKGKALVYIIRPSFFGKIIKFRVYCGNEYIGYTTGKRYLYIYLEPGKYNIISKAENKSELQLDVEADKTYYVQQKVRFGFIISRNKLIQLNVTEGEIAKSKCRLSKSLEKKII